MKKNTNLTAIGVAAEIVTITDRLCAEHLDAEYGALCRKAKIRVIHDPTADRQLSCAG